MYKRTNTSPLVESAQKSPLPYPSKIQDSIFKFDLLFRYVYLFVPAEGRGKTNDNTCKEITSCMCVRVRNMWGLFMKYVYQFGAF